MRRLGRFSGTVILCDVAQQDRGKINILGAGWSQIGPDADGITTLVNIQVPPAYEGDEVVVRLHLWRHEPFMNDAGEPDATAEVIASLDPEVAGDVIPPSWQILVPIPLQVKLRPATGYVVELAVNEESLAFVTFATRDYEPDKPAVENVHA